MENYNYNPEKFYIPNPDFKLSKPNKFGNYDRFTDENGLQEYKKKLAIDHVYDTKIKFLGGGDLSNIQIPEHPTLFKPSIEAFKELIKQSDQY